MGLISAMCCDLRRAALVHLGIGGLDSHVLLSTVTYTRPSALDGCHGRGYMDDT